MNQLFKNYFWAVKLAGVALMALLVAGGVNDFIAGKLFVVPKAPDVGAAGEGGAEAAPAWGRVAAADAATELKGRLVFNLDPARAEAIAEVEEPKDKPKDDDVKPEGELEESDLAIDLIGTLVAADHGSSMATLQVEGANKIGWVGSELLDGKAKIVKIQPRHIVIKEESKFTVVKLWGDKAAAGKRPSPGRPGLKPSKKPRAVTQHSRPAPVSGSSRTQRANRIREGVKKTGAYDYQVSRNMIDEELKDLGKLQSEARVVPHYKNQKYEGFKLVGVRPGSLYRALGIRSGDVIKSVNGTAIDSPNKAIELFEQLKSSSDIKVDIERRGQPKTLGYTIQ